MKLPPLGDDFGFLALSDAAWATRPDGSSQGGYLILAVPQAAFSDELTSYSIIDWRSWKLERVSRSSLNAETQAAATAADALEFAKAFFGLISNPDAGIKDPDIRNQRSSALVVDAKKPL